MKDSKVDAVVVSGLDRLSRSVEDILDLAKFFHRPDVAFHSIAERLDDIYARFLNFLAGVFP